MKLAGWLTQALSIGVFECVFAPVTVVRAYIRNIDGDRCRSPPYPASAIASQSPERRLRRVPPTTWCVLSNDRLIDPRICCRDAHGCSSGTERRPDRSSAGGRRRGSSLAQSRLTYA